VTFHPTTSVRVQASIEILDLIIAAARNNGAPADRIVSEWFRTRRFAGSGDRRAVREIVYSAIRRCGEVPLSGRAALLTLAKGDPALASLFDGSAHAPPAIGEGERFARAGTAPRWLEQALAASGIDAEEAAALLGRAPLDLRANTLKAERETLDLPIEAELTAALNGLRLPHGTQVEQWDAYQNGLIEVQDTGSQLACEALAAQPGETVIDLCAGAGGKTLALAATMAGKGTLLATDTDRGRLQRLPPRAERAGAGGIETLLLNPGRENDVLGDWQNRAHAVLVDAPCSGTGTWRRNPEARWRLNEGQLERYVATQERLLDLAVKLVRPGGRLIYVVCSLLDSEGAGQIGGLLSRHHGWRADPPQLPRGTSRGPGIRLTPLHDGTDGFFIARLTRL
jgi:16S rRNA (cytosine967-C5)-methyltransferase